MRRDIGRHAHGNAAGAIDQQVGHARGQHHRLMFGAVVIGYVINGFLVDVFQQLMGNPGHADFGIAHRRRRIAVHRAEIALPVHQHIAQGKMLGHAHDGVVHGGIPMRVIFTDDIADNARRFLVGFVVVVAHLVHGKQHPPVHGFQSVAHIRQRAPDDDAHGVIHIGLTHLVFNVDRHDRAGDLVRHNSL